MFTENQFAELSVSISPILMKTYVVVMILMVVGGTLFDVLHKKSAVYFSNNWQKIKDKGTREVGSGECCGEA